MLDTLNTTKGKGFTLIEAMIYLALFSILMGGAVVATYQLLSGGAHNEKEVSIQEEGTFIIRKINWTLSGAVSATTSGATSLLVTKPDTSIDTISADGQSLYIEHSSDSSPQPIKLNSDAFVVNNVIFSVVPATADGKPESVDASFDVAGVPFIFERYLR